MPKYLFTSDLRISQLSDKIQYFAKFFNEGGDITDIQDKSENNNANTLKFYFNLHKDTEICQLAEKSPKDAIRNFITKFQFPNPRTKESLKDSLDEGILLAPYRTIIHILNALDSQNNITSISYQEILYWVFCHRGVTQDPFYDIKTLVSKIKFDRNADYERLIKESLAWKQYERQSRELIKILTYSSNCFYTKDNKLFFNRNHPDYLSDKSFIDEVASYNKFWIPSENGSYEQITNEYISYMDTRDTAYNIVKISRNKISHELVGTTSISNSFRPYFTAIRTKPFLLLAGISGTGKSRIVKDMAFQTCPNVGDLRSDNVSPGNYCLVEVKPNWHDSTELLGYDSVISGGYIVTKFVKFLVKAMLNDDIPFFVCLDEMNLAPVEQYFAEFLSVLESRKKEGEEITSEALIDASVFKKHEATLFADLFDKEVKKTSPYGVVELTEDKAHYGKEYEVYERLKQEGLRIPKNLIVIGTVNMDETTHQFSRKVIDRAMTIEMNIAEGEQPFKDFFASDSELIYYDNPLSANLFLPKNVTAKQAMDELDLAEQDKLKELVPERLAAINNALDGTPFKIAYRVQNELLIYYCEMRRIDTETKTPELLNKAIDGILMMKVLPRVEGDRDLLEKPLEKLANICNDGYPEAYKKIKEMQGRLESAPFTSFWP